ncbi:phosphoenolpyruvate hydrolase family protein [Roseinatronobacter sp.]|uniref:phosphoenolpyruvate hydrolase family protein n=1 Tax=Roseinatronobacter sp. TaxID=1945755 RepID=UPI0025DE7401|nr:phosphoenolpyruvate hydrolase family protein [Rhodobaca sp.]
MAQQMRKYVHDGHEWTMTQALQTTFPRQQGGDTLLVGGAIGIGMTAEAAVRGGADFLLALNAGRYRVMGAPSVSAMLPIGNSNSFTDNFARREILDRVSVPVFFGASCFDPAKSPEALVEQASEAGYHGMANFPSAIHFDGRFRQLLEEAGIGFEREAQMLALARQAGLMTFGYAKTRTEISRLVDAGASMICLNFGWNAGGVLSVAQSFTISEAADRARRIFASIRARAPETLCFFEGGPIISPDDMFRVCAEARADGYVGGSTLDRVPLEHSVTERTSAFKAFEFLKQTDSAQSRALSRVARITGVVGQSEFVMAVLDRVSRLAPTGLPVLISGEAGLGRGALARGLHALAERQGPLLSLRAPEVGEDAEEILFGSGPTRRAMLARLGATVVIEGADTLPPHVQLRLAEWLEKGELLPTGLRATESARLILIKQPTGGANGPALEPSLAQRLEPGRIDITPLRDRPEDIPAIARHILSLLDAGQAQHRQISAAGYRMLLAQAWPGNTPALRSVIARAAVNTKGAVIGSTALAAAIRDLSPGAVEVDAPQQMTERDWLLDGLRRNRFRRGDTAAFLGVSRKTLYNKMRREGLLE